MSPPDLIDADDLAEEAALEPLPEPALPRPPQGITVRYMQTGDRRRDYHVRHRHVPVIDPESLRRPDGEDPYLALPTGDESRPIRIKQVKAEHAAPLLTCDERTGGASVHRLATDAEVAQYLKETAARIAGEAVNRDAYHAKQQAQYRAEAERAERSRTAVREILGPQGGGSR